MANYLAPFHMPRFTDEEFRQKKAAYVAEHGYSITFPRLGDIIHVPIIQPMTTQEKSLWYSGRKNEIPEHRQLHLQAIKERNREKYQRMMASPVPEWANSFASILAAADDAQDAIITLAAIGRIFTKFLPRFLTRFFAGPIGWLWLIAELMSLLMAPAGCALNPMACKKILRKKMARRAKNLKAGVKGYAKSGGFMPSFAEGIQVLQVTDNIFGWGLSIGPIFGLAYDLASGGVRWVRGEKVSFKSAPSDVEIYRKAGDTIHDYARWKRPKSNMTRSEYLDWKEERIKSGSWGVRSQQDDMVSKAMKLHTTWGGVIRRTDYMEETLFYCGAELAGQGVKNLLDYWNPMENVEGLEHLQIRAYDEPNPMLEEMLIEEGLDPEKGIAWPSLGKEWATYEEISRTTAPIAAGNFSHFTETCPSESLKIVAENSAIEGALHNIAMLEGEQRIRIQYHAAIDIAETLLDNRYSLPLNVTQEQINRFGQWMLDHEQLDTRPTLSEILDFAKISAGFEFITK